MVARTRDGLPFQKVRKCDVVSEAALLLQPQLTKWKPVGGIKHNSLAY